MKQLIPLKSIYLLLFVKRNNYTVKEKIIKAEKKNPEVYALEQIFWAKNQLICGVDEVGRGCLAGPIITSAVILHPHKIHPKMKDSKLLTKLQIENIFQWIITNSTYSIGISHHRIIDKKNIYATTQTTMKKALFHLLQSTNTTPDLIAIDAMPLDLHNTPYANIPIESWTQGESKSASIAAASIVAKVTRDRILQKMDLSFPCYELRNHKGYGTSTHIKALKLHGASIIHRKTFIKNFKESVHDTPQQQSLFR